MDGERAREGSKVGPLLSHIHLLNFLTRTRLMKKYFFSVCLQANERARVNQTHYYEIEWIECKSIDWVRVELNINFVSKGRVACEFNELMQQVNWFKVLSRVSTRKMRRGKHERGKFVLNFFESSSWENFKVIRGNLLGGLWDNFSF